MAWSGLSEEVPFKLRYKKWAESILLWGRVGRWEFWEGATCAKALKWERQWSAGGIERRPAWQESREQDRVVLDKIGETDRHTPQIIGDYKSRRP